ncbi:MAG: RsmD family RNA methyltransferase [Salinivirgaceae bacterium]|nr:RsmD family RNA methyltransferase [Salinivirgaceae bacterium]
MDKETITRKFGNYYYTDDYSFIMGIDIRFSDHIAQRFKNRIVLETCSGAGFTTISLAKYAKHVYSVEIDKTRLEAAKKNSQIAGSEKKITFINGDVTTKKILNLVPEIDSVFIDPDWAVTGDNHIYRFLNSTTKPPSDILVNLINTRTLNITLVQPPYIDKQEFKKLPLHECEHLYLNGNHELYCLHFGELANLIGDSRYNVFDD